MILYNRFGQFFVSQYIFSMSDLAFEKLGSKRTEESSGI